jgi:hypothetical protein
MFKVQSSKNSAIRILGGGLHNYGFTVSFLPLSQDLGLSRAATSLAFSRTALMIKPWDNIRVPRIEI